MAALKKARLVYPGSKNQGWMSTWLPKYLHKRLQGHKTYPKSNCNDQKQINPCWKIAHTKTSKLPGGTSTSNTFGQDTMIILPLSQKTVRGSTMSGSHYHGPQDKVQQKGIFSVRLVFPKHKYKKLPSPCVEKQVCLHSCIASRTAACRNTVTKIESLAISSI